MRAYEITQQLMTPGCTVLTAEYISMMGFYSDWPVSVEFTAGLSERLRCRQRNFQTATEDNAVCNILVYAMH